MNYQAVCDRKLGRTKRRKPNRPALRKKAITLAKLICRMKVDKCEVCGRTGKLDAHHLIPVSHSTNHYACELENLIALCKNCHRLNPFSSAHNAPLDFLIRLNEVWPERYRWWQEHHQEVYPGEKIDWQAKIDELNEIKKHIEERKSGL